MESLLTFEVGAEADELFIHGDPAGLRRLAAILEKLATNAELGNFPHEHLFAAEWGGEELSSLAQEVAGRALLHVKNIWLARLAWLSATPNPAGLMS